MKLKYYVGFRILMIIPTLLIILTLVFFIMHVLPGDPVRIMWGEEIPDTIIEEIRHNLGLDRPIHIQYIEYLKKFIRGDFGTSYRYKVSVLDKVKEVWPTTLEITIGGILLSIIMGIPLGIICALRKGGIIDQVTRIFSLYLYSNPSFWLALILQIYLGLTWGLLPTSGRCSLSYDIPRVTGMITIDSIMALNFRALFENLRYLIMPWLTVALVRMPRYARISRASLLNVLGEDYIITARAKGVRERTVIIKHALRNAILPIITMLAGSFVWLLGGTVFIEMIFSQPGMGRLLLEGLRGRDFNMIQGIVAIYAIIVVGLNTVVEVIYAVADPRIKY